MQQIRDGSNPDQFTNTDWAEETLRDAPMQNHYLALSGGSANTTYRFSLGYMYQGSVVIGKFHLDRYNFRANVQSRLKNWLTIKIGRAHVRTPVTNAHLVSRLLLAKT